MSATISLTFGSCRVLGRVVDRDAVVGDADLAVEEGLVVVRVQPRQRAGHERRVQLLGVLQRLDGLGAVDDHLVVLVDHLPPCAQTSQWTQLPSPTALPSAKPPGVPFSFRALHSFEKAIGVLRELSKPAAFTWLMR
jgi:hypothetical protein